MPRWLVFPFVALGACASLQREVSPRLGIPLPAASSEHTLRVECQEFVEDHKVGCLYLLVDEDARQICIMVVESTDGDTWTLNEEESTCGVKLRMPDMRSGSARSSDDHSL